MGASGTQVGTGAPHAGMVPVKYPIDISLWLALILLLLGAVVNVPRNDPKTTCGGKEGQHCGCVAEGCVEPCSSCCSVMPCPVEGECGDD